MCTLYELFNIIHSDDFNVEEYLHQYKYSVRGHYYESIFKIFVLCGCFKDLQLLDNNYNIIIDKKYYMKHTNVNDGNSSGKVDIKLTNGSKKILISSKYAMTEGSAAIAYETDEEADKIIKALNSKKFNDFIKYNFWSGGFKINYILFKYLSKDFYKYFI